MKNTGAWGVTVGVVLALAGACGSNATSVEETSALHGSESSIAACCHRAFRSGRLRGRCLAEAAHGRGVCGHLRRPDGGSCDAASGGSGGAAGEGGIGGAGGEAGGGVGGETGEGGAGGGAGGGGGSDAGSSQLGGAGGSATVDAAPDAPGGASGSSGGGGAIDGGNGGGGGSSVCAQPSSENVWARVIVNPEQGGLTAIQALGNTVWGVLGRGWLMSWDGSAWTVASPLLGIDYIIRGSTAGDLWFKGNLNLRDIRRWNGTTAIDVSPDASVAWVDNVQVVNGSDAWGLMTNMQGSDRVGEVRRWDGTAWNKIPLPSDLPAQLLMQEVWVAAANDVWITALGADTGPALWRGLLLHWDGTAIRRVSFGVPLEESIRIGGLWASSPTDVWLSSASLTARRLLHYDGTAWTQAFDGLFFDQMWGNCATDVWGMSADGIRHFDGTGWSRVTAPTEPDGTLVPGRISGTGTDDVWVSGGRPLHWAKDFCGNTVIGPGEDCEPPDTQAGQKPACDHACRIPRCGNLAIDSGETCDPPNGVTCDQQCQSIPIVCGNGIVQPGEACDPPNGSNCSQQCQINDLSCGECTVGAERCDPTTFGPIYCVLGADGCGHWGPAPPRNGCTGQFTPGCESTNSPFYCYRDGAGCRVEGRCPDGMFCPSGFAGCIPQP
jgi:hypothetical protein